MWRSQAWRRGAASVNCFLEGRDTKTARPSWRVEGHATVMTGGAGGQKTKVPARSTSLACDRHLFKAEPQPCKHFQQKS